MKKKKVAENIMAFSFETNSCCIIGLTHAIEYVEEQNGEKKDTDKEIGMNEEIG